jgi:hypothetical protein
MNLLHRLAAPQADQLLGLFNDDSTLLADRVPEALAGPECGHTGGRDLDLLAGLRIAPGAGGTVAHLEGSKTNELDLLPFCQSLFDYVEYGGDNLLSVSLGNFGFFSHTANQFSLIQPNALLCIFSLGLPISPEAL